MMGKTYYRQVEAYYDEDAPDFDSRYWKNPVLQRIRQDFREEVKRHTYRRMLEIGCGTGLDLLHFGKTHPGVRIAGIDISGEMCRIASERIRQEKLANVQVEKAGVEEIEALFGRSQFDMVYVFFGALNTVKDLWAAASALDRVVVPGGVLVLSFVNRHYIAGMLIEMLKLRFRSAFSRLKPEWGGYSPARHLPSRCYTPAEIKNAFRAFEPKKRKGYSILHPAWYYHRLNHLTRRFSRYLWKADMALNKTLFWRFGEYTLFVFQKPDDIRQ
jgi:ubiquinone/menaquinone biosynthesis C-methylase UbiE